MYICMYACMYVCIYVFMSVCMYVRMYVCMYVCMCMCMCVYACMSVCLSVCLSVLVVFAHRFASSARSLAVRGRTGALGHGPGRGYVSNPTLIIGKYIQISIVDTRSTREATSRLSTSYQALAHISTGSQKPQHSKQHMSKGFKEH